MQTREAESRPIIKAVGNYEPQYLFLKLLDKPIPVPFDFTIEEFGADGRDKACCCQASNRANY